MYSRQIISATTVILGPILPESQDAFGNQVSFIPLDFEDGANLDGLALKITLSQAVFNVFNMVNMVALWDSQEKVKLAVQ